MAIPTRLRDPRAAVQKILGRFETLLTPARETETRQFMILAGPRDPEETVEQEMKKMAVVTDSMENKVLGREFKRGLQEGEVAILRRQIAGRFGAIPDWMEERLNSMSSDQLERFGLTIMRSTSL